MKATKKNIFVSFIEKINIRTCIVIYIILMTIPLLYMSFFSYPAVDDFSYSMNLSLAVESGDWTIFELVKLAAETSASFYGWWQGTYVSTFLMPLQPGIFGEQYYFLTTWIMIFIMVASFLYSGKILFNLIKVDNKTACFLSLLIWFYFVQTIPSPRESMFWFNGSVHYIPFICLTLIMIAKLLKGYNSSFKIIDIIILTIVGFIISGGNQLTGFLNIFNILMLLVYILIFGKDKSKIKLILMPFISSIAGFVIMALSPGNQTRSSSLEGTQSVIKTIFASAIEYFDLAFNYWINSSFLLFLLLITPFVINITKKIKGFSYKGFALVVIVQYMAICGMMCTIYIVSGGFGGTATRTANTFYVFFLISAILVYGYLIGLAQEKNIIKLNFPALTFFLKNLLGGILSLFILVVIFFIGSNYMQYSTSGMALAEMYGTTHIIYKQQMDHRLEIYNDESITEAVFEPQITSVFFGFEELHDFPFSKHWPNSSIAEYYDKEWVYIVKNEQ